MKRLLIAIAFFACALRAVESSVAYVPNTQTDLVTSTVRLSKLHLANVTGGAITVLIKDRTTNCNSASCQIWPTVSIAANSVYTADLQGVPANSGASWQASAANSVVGWITWY